MNNSSWCLEGEEIDHPTDTTINKMLEDLLENKPEIQEAIALINADDNKTVTYKELNETANILARTLLRKINKHSINPNPDGDYIVALRFHPGVELIATILAICKAGLAYVPIAPTWPERRIKQIIEDAAPGMLITNTEAEILYNVQGNLSIEERREVFQYDNLVDEARDSNTSKENIPTKMRINKSLGGGTLFSVLYTSGSTGIPKGVRHSHTAALNRFHWQWRTFPYEDDEVCIFKTTLVFADSITEIWCPLLSGKKLVIVQTYVTQNVEKFVDVLEQFKIGRVFAVTSLVRSILAFLKLSNSKKSCLSCVKIWECTGEILTKDVLLAFFDYFKCGHQISNLYDSTEMMGGIYDTFTNAKQVQSVLIEDKVPIGAPIDNTKAYVLDENLEPVGEGVTGSLYITGRNLANGYVGTNTERFMKNHVYRNDTKAKQDEIHKNYGALYKTGDFASIHHGRIYYEGRLDSQIKVRGHRVDLAEIEKAVYAVEEVAKVAILCYKPGEPQQKVLCYFTSQKGVLPTAAEVEQSLTQIMPSYMMPKILKLDSMPLLVNGKTDRQALLTKFEESQSWTSFTFTDTDLDGQGVPTSRFPIAKVVLESVASVIQDSSHKPTLSDNFFNIGGDSINMVMVIAHINECGYNITVTDFITSSNLSNTVGAVSSKSRVEDLSRFEKSNAYMSGELEHGHKETVINMISRSFADKEPLVTLMRVSYENMQEHLQKSWDSFMKESLSIVIKNQSGDVVGACLNLDARSAEPDPPLQQFEGGSNEGLLTIFQFLDAIELPILEQHVPAEPGKFIHTNLLGTANHLTSTENIEVALLMEKETIRLGQLKGYKGILTTNTNMLTQKICKDLDYEVPITIQLNKYEDLHGARPFSTAPDEQTAEVAIKKF